MQRVVLSAGSPDVRMSPERRRDVEELSAELRSAGFGVSLRITDYEPGRDPGHHERSENISFTIVGLEESLRLTDLTNDLLARGNLWMVRRFARKMEEDPTAVHQPEQLTIFGPEGERLKISRYMRQRGS